MTSTTAPAAAFADLVQAAKGRVVCLAMSKDPNAKMTVLLFAKGGSAPERVAKVPTTEAAALRVEAEAAVLRELALLDLGPLAGTVPRVLAMADDRGRPVLVTTALPGRQMLAAYHTWRHTARPAAVRADFTAAGGWLAELVERTVGGDADLATMLDGTAAKLERRFCADPALGADLEHLAGLRAELSGHRVRLACVHGDFWPGNLLVDGGTISGVVDWESARLGALAVRDVAHFALTYSLYLDRHTRPGRPVAGHQGLRAGAWGAGLDYALDARGWYPELVRAWVGEGLERLGVPSSLARGVLLAQLACNAAEADHPEFAANTLLAYRRLSRVRS